MHAMTFEPEMSGYGSVEDERVIVGIAYVMGTAVGGGCQPD